MKKKIMLSILLVLGLACLAGCTVTNEIVTNELEDESSLVLSESKFNDGQTSAVDTIEIPGETFSLQCTYDTGKLPLNNWRVTSNKNLNMTVNTYNLPEGYEVHIEHVHADASLKSTDTQVDGITHDTMDDSDHRTPTKGFPISDTISYNNVFAIEGYNCQFYEIWGHTYGDYGHVSSSYKKLTEGNILKSGCYAEKISIVYDIVITPPGHEEGYVRSVYSELFIPLNPLVLYEIYDMRSGETIYELKNVLTDEVVERYNSLPEKE